MRAAGAAKMVFCVTSAAAGAAKNHSLQLGSAAITAWRLGGEHVVTWSVSFDDSRFSKSLSCTAAVLAVRSYGSRACLLSFCSRASDQPEGVQRPKVIKTSR
jgi:hypothetical protein